MGQTEQENWAEMKVFGYEITVQKIETEEPCPWVLERMLTVQERLDEGIKQIVKVKYCVRCGKEIGEPHVQVQAYNIYIGAPETWEISRMCTNPHCPYEDSAVIGTGAFGLSVYYQDYVYVIPSREVVDRDGKVSRIL